MLLRLLFCLLLLVPAAPTAALELSDAERAWLLAHKNSIRVGVLPNYPPIEFVVDGRQQGLTADYLRAVEEALDVRFRRVFAPDWNTLMHMARERRIDVIGSIQKVAERETFLRFTAPYVSLPNAIITRTGGDDNLDEFDLSGRKVALVRGYANSSYLRKRIATLQEITVSSDVEALQAVAFGLADAAVVDLAVASYNIDRLGLTGLKVAGYIDYRWDLRFGIRKDWPVLAELFDRALADIPAEVKQSWRHRWISLEHTDILSDRELKIAAGVFGLLTLVIIWALFWNRLLKRRVDRATTQLQQALASARQSEAQLRELTDTLPQTVFEIDPDGTIRYVNRYALEWSGYPPEQLISRKIQDFLLPEDRPVMAQRIRILLGQEPDTPGERIYRVQRADGSIRQVLGYARPIRREGETVGLRGILVDISDRLSYEMFIDHLFDALPDPVFVKDRQHRWIRFNQAFCDLIGKTPEELRGKSDFDLFPEEEARHVWRKDDEVFDSGKVDLAVETITPPGKPPRVLATRKSRMTGPDGELLLIASIRDITEQEEAARRLRESEERFRQIFNAASEALFLHEPDTGRIIDVNRTAEIMFAAGRDQLIGCTPEDFSSNQGPFTGSAALDILGELEEGEPKILEWQGRRFDGRLFWGEVVLKKVTLGDRPVVVAGVRDISRRKELEEMMLQAEKMLTVGHLAAGIAHEINNPLAGVLQNLQMVQLQLQGGHPGNRKAAETAGLDLTALQTYLQLRQTDQLLDKALTSAQRARFIVEDLLTFSRRPGEAMQPVDLEKLIDQTLTLVETEYDPGGSYDFRAIRVEKHVHGRPPKVPAWRDQLQQALINLLRNAAQAMYEARTRAPSIRIDIGLDQGQALVKVTDNGPGMNEAIRSRIFEPFFTTRSGRGGTGIGLALVSYIITQNHGGTIAVESEPGRGTTFVIRLPGLVSEEP